MRPSERNIRLLKQKILIVGDSLTAGHPGARYISYLKRELPGVRIKSAGKGGRTLRDTALILPSLMQRYHPDILVIETGTNDLLLPFLKERGGQWFHRIHEAEQKGGLPLPNPSHFQTVYECSLKMLSTLGCRSPLLITIACLGEDLETPLNRKRRIHNDVIRGLCANDGACLVDTAARFERMLSRKQRPNSYLLDDPGSINDRLLKKLARWSDSLSRKRGLRLTIDGVHFNRRGARIYARVVSNTLRKFL